MARADRLERLDRRRIGLEEDYRAALIAALKVTAAGAWGLFDHRQDRHDRARAAPAEKSRSSAEAKTAMDDFNNCTMKFPFVC